ncbi:hypothetical protein J7643_16420 [bacterium]|nr:hypothetical protein [bacterium]
MTRRLLHAALAATMLLAAACQASNLPPGPDGLFSTQGARLAVQGSVSFGDRTAQIAPDALTRLATVTLIDSANRTVATTRTDAAGAFTLLPSAAFAVANGDVFYLDAYKGTRDNAIGADVARLRTILQWTNTGWKSISGPSVVLNPLTTAVAVIQGLVPGSVAATATLGTVSGTTVTTGNGTLNVNWSAVQALVKDLLSKDQDPLARIVYRDAAFRVVTDLAQPLVVENFRGGTFAETQVDPTGRLLLAPPKPTPTNPTSELEVFAASGVAPDSAGAITTDGTYLYVNGWSTWGKNTANNGVLKKIGTGFNGTVRGANYGTLGTAPPNVSISLAYYKGYVYIPMAKQPTQLFRVSVTTGATTIIDLPTTLYAYNQSKITVNAAAPLVTTDGRYFYNVSSTVDASVDRTDNGFTVKILDPEQGFQVVKAYTLDTTSFYNDGLFCDGTYLYMMEWSAAANTARMRRYRLADGVREAEWTYDRVGRSGATSGVYDPDRNLPINGCWDPFNRVFWVGQLANERIHLLRGGNFIPTGTWTSAALDAGSADPHFGRLGWQVSEASTGSKLSFQVRSADTLGALGAATWYGPTSTTDAYTASDTPLNPIHAKHRYLQVRATFGASTDLLTSPTLSRLSVEVLP